MRSFSVYDFDHYKDFLKQELATKGPRRGRRSKLAKKLRCEPGRITQVLSGADHFNLEQAFQISSELGLHEKEREFFLNLYFKDRAASAEVREYFSKKLQAQGLERKQVLSRIKKGERITPSMQNLYYGSWIYAAVHMGCLSKTRQTVESLSQYFGLPLALVRDALEVLLSLGLVEERDGRYSTRHVRIHLDEKGSQLKLHHLNWRLRALQDIQEGRPHGLHFSSVMSVSKPAVEAIRELLLKLIHDTEGLISQSGDDDVVILNLDLFDMKSGSHRS